MVSRARPGGPGQQLPQTPQPFRPTPGPGPAGPPGPQRHPVPGAGPAAQVHRPVHRHRQAQPGQAQGAGGVRGQPPEPLRRPRLPGRPGRASAGAAGGGRRRRLLLQLGGEGAPPPRPALGTVPFVRSAASRESLQFLKDLAGSGWSVLIFPSGTRGRRLRLQEGLRLHRRRRPGAGGPHVPARARAGDAQGLVRAPARRGGDRHR